MILFLIFCYPSIELTCKIYCIKKKVCKQIEQYVLFEPTTDIMKKNQSIMYVV